MSDRPRCHKAVLYRGLHRRHPLREDSPILGARRRLGKDETNYQAKGALTYVKCCSGVQQDVPAVSLQRCQHAAVEPTGKLKKKITFTFDLDL